MPRFNGAITLKERPLGNFKRRQGESIPNFEEQDTSNLEDFNVNRLNKERNVGPMKF